MSSRLRHLLAAAVTVAATAALVVSVGPASAVKGGTESTETYSFMGSLQRPNEPDVHSPDKHVCGAMIVAPRWALTASHCARTPNQAPVGTPRGWRIRVGSLNTTSGGEVVEVDRFYRRAVESEGFFGRDLALLHLATPVSAEPVRLAEHTPAAGTSARLLGWGMTCDDKDNPDCYPTHLREVDLDVQERTTCPEANDGEICVGPLDGSAGATNMDSGGPALVRDGDAWVVAGTVSGPSSAGPTLFTDVSQHLDWIAGIVEGTDVPPEVPVPPLDGAVDLGGCVGSVVRTDDAQPDDPALLLTNGHCVEGDRPAPGSALVDQPADREVTIADTEGYPQVTTRADRLVYATMTGTDVALYRLDETYAQLADAGARIFRLTDTPPVVGDQVDVLTTYRRMPCTVEAVVPHLREAGYQLDGSLRYAAGDRCRLGQGNSGSALVSPDGDTVVGIHNTTNLDGELCTENNPCEVAEDGTQTALPDRSYAQQVTGIAPCLAPGSVLDLTRPNCTLTRPAA
jgi:trypsin/trypsin-like peptidase